jgi:hypothetical protein
MLTSSHDCKSVTNFEIFIHTYQCYFHIYVINKNTNNNASVFNHINALDVMKLSKMVTCIYPYVIMAP